MITKDTILPTYEELTVEECNLSSPFLKAGAMHLGKHCEVLNNVLSNLSERLREELLVEHSNIISQVGEVGKNFPLEEKVESMEMQVKEEEFMLCRQETKDPRQCLNAGKAVTACSMEFFRKVKKNCAQEFTEYAKCLDMSGPDMRFEKCRNTQAVFDSCMFEKLGMIRPPFGYFSEVRIHDSSRAAPKPAPPLVFPDALPEIPTPEELPRPKNARHGLRFFGVT